LLVVDTSGSMAGDKIEQAKQAATIFVNNMPPQNQVGLITFESSVNELVPLASAEGNQAEMTNQINSLRAEGDTALYDAIQQSIEFLKSSRGEEDDRIQSVVVLSDGQDTYSQITLQQVVEVINASHEDRNPVIVIPVAYGGDADINALNSIARASATRVQSGNPEDIQSLLELISSYF
jgi:Ca-activated chloride channel family protein